MLTILGSLRIYLGLALTSGPAAVMPDGGGHAVLLEVP